MRFMCVVDYLGDFLLFTYKCRISQLRVRSRCRAARALELSANFVASLPAYTYV